MAHPDLQLCPQDLAQPRLGVVVLMCRHLHPPEHGQSQLETIATSRFSFGEAAEVGQEETTVRLLEVAAEVDITKWFLTTPHCRIQL
jgi:hypothetical protein